MLPPPPLWTQHVQRLSRQGIGVVAGLFGLDLAFVCILLTIMSSVPRPGDVERRLQD